MNKTVLAAICGLFSAFNLPLQASEKPLSAAELFAKGSEYFNPKLSPGGDYLALETHSDGKDVLLVLDANTLTPINELSFRKNAEVGNFYWANDERLVVSKDYLVRDRSAPVYYGELLATNADGSKTEYLVGYADRDTIKYNSTPLRATSYVLDPLPNDKRKVLIASVPWTDRTDNFVDMDNRQFVYLVDIYNGKRRRITVAPQGNSQFLTDAEGELKIAMGLNAEHQAEVYRYEDEKWQRLTNPAISNLTSLSPISLESAESVLIQASDKGAPLSIYRLNLENGTKELVTTNPNADPSDFLLGANNQLYAVGYEDGYPSTIVVNPADPRSQYLKQIQTSVPGKRVRLISETRKADKFIVHISSDRNPGDYYLLSTNPMSLNYLFAQRHWLHPDKMAEVRPLSFKNRQGQQIGAYLTLPPSRPMKNLPLVVMPHGGPIGVRNSWQFEEETQLLANQGYAVLQVNFRGSAGYGPQFTHAGYGQWGTGIQEDIIDGTQFLINQQIVDAKRICISGSSFGGYSAMQSAIIEPDLFKCAIGYAGVYDLEMLFTEGDIRKSASGINYLNKALGNNPTQLKSISPSNSADKIKAAVMLVHGGKDERAPLEQYEAMAEALEKANHPFKTLVVDDEGHGFYKDEHRAKYYTEMLAFLEQHLN